MKFPLVELSRPDLTFSRFFRKFSSFSRFPVKNLKSRFSQVFAGNGYPGFLKVLIVFSICILCNFTDSLKQSLTLLYSQLTGVISTMLILEFTHIALPSCTLSWIFFWIKFLLSLWGIGLFDFPCSTMKSRCHFLVLILFQVMF